jgi:hypothetical protein
MGKTSIVCPWSFLSNRLVFSILLCLQNRLLIAAIFRNTFLFYMLMFLKWKVDIEYVSVPPFTLFEDYY